MKTLTLLRHAKSSWAIPGQRDFDRPLNGRGRKAARALGAEMKRLGLRFDLILASPAQRTTETLEEAATSYGPLPACFDERIYLAAPRTLLALARETDDDAQSLLLVGHNPGTEELALLLSAKGEKRDLMAVKYPTGALAELSFAVESWAEIDEGTATLTRFLRPRDLDPALGPDGAD